MGIKKTFEKGTYKSTLRQNARSDLTKTCFCIMIGFFDSDFKRSINR